MSQFVSYVHLHHLLLISRRVNRKQWAMYSASYILDLHTSRFGARFGGSGRVSIRVDMYKQEDSDSVAKKSKCEIL